MASAPTTILNFSPGSLTSPFTTASFTPVTDTRLIVFAGAARNAAMTDEPTISDSAGLSWIKIGSIKTSTFANPDLWLVGWISNVISASPAAMTVTITNPSANAVCACVISVPAIDTDGTVIQAASGEDLAAGDPSFTFAAAPDANRLVVGANWHGGGNNITKPTGYTNLFDNTPSALTARRAECFYDNTSAAQGPNQTTSTNIRSLVLAVELGISAAGRTKIWDGTSWNVKPTKIWDGTSWNVKPLKVWNGSAWI